MSRELFGTLFKLTSEQPWLVRRATELYDTVTLCETDDQKKLLVDLISRFHFRSAQNHIDDLRAIASKISDGWKCSPEDTILVALEDRALADSTAMLVQQLKGPLAELGNWKTGNFISRLREGVERAKDGSNIVIVDDFSGSGKTIADKVAWLKKELVEAEKDASIRVAVGSAMEQSKELISPIVYDFYAVHWLSKGLHGHYQNDELVEAIATMELIEGKLSVRHGQKKIQDYSFGWRKSEALYYLDGGNPPNNNFPIFWWPTLKNKKPLKTLLPRV